MKQEITSKDTSIRQIPRLHKLIDVQGKRVLDYGCGKYDDGANYLLAMGAEDVASYDPYNRDPEQNVEAAIWMAESSADIVLCGNVLNVVQESHERIRILVDCCRALKFGGFAYFSVYEGNRSGRGKVTTKGWQANRKTREYLREITEVFPEVSIGNRVIRGVKA